MAFHLSCTSQFKFQVTVHCKWQTVNVICFQYSVAYPSHWEPWPPLSLSLHLSTIPHLHPLSLAPILPITTVQSDRTIAELRHITTITRDSTSFGHFSFISPLRNPIFNIRLSNFRHFIFHTSLQNPRFWYPLFNPYFWCFLYIRFWWFFHLINTVLCSTTTATIAATTWFTPSTITFCWFWISEFYVGAPTFAVTKFSIDYSNS